MPSAGAAEQGRDRQAGDLAGDVPQGDLERPVAAGVEVDRLERPDVPGDGQRVLADEQVLVRLEAVHRVARADPDDPLVGLDPDDRRRERAPRDRVPGGRERRVERHDEAVEADAGDAHVRSIAQPQRGRFVDSRDGPPVPFRDTSVARLEDRCIRAARCVSRSMRSSAGARRRQVVSPEEDPGRWTIPKLDKVRRASTPLQLDVVESFAGGRLSRREFITARLDRRPVDGLDDGAVIAACSSSASPSPSAAAGGGPDGRRQRRPRRRPRHPHRR